MKKKDNNTMNDVRNPEFKMGVNITAIVFEFKLYKVDVQFVAVIKVVRKIITYEMYSYRLILLFLPYQKIIAASTDHKTAVMKLLNWTEIVSVINAITNPIVQ